MLQLIGVVCTIVVASLYPALAHAWGPEGHAIVAEIAQRRLDPAARDAVRTLLGTDASLASLSSWADDVRDQRPGTYNWHFVDIPLAGGDYNAARDCPPSAKGDCVVAEIGRLRRELRCAPAMEARVEALKFAVHFVADIHQPLHALGDKRGGNDQPVQGSIHGKICKGQCDVAPEAKNLHALWDSLLIRRTVWNWGAYVDRLEGAWLRSDGFEQRMTGDTAADWASQSHAVGRTIWSPDLVPPDGTIDDSYYETVLPILDQQLALGGVRLARLLNEAFSSPACGDGADAVSRTLPSAAAGLTPASNLGDLKGALTRYHDMRRDNGQSAYERDQSAVGEAATAWVKRQAAQVGRPAMVLDVDETALDNWLEIKRNDFGYIVKGACTLEPGTSCGALAWNESGKAPAVKATLALFEAARSNGVAVFFITGRHEAERAATEANLRAAGYEGWAGLIMRPDGWSTPSAANFKAPERARLVREGYTIIANVGDQPSDLAGGYAQRSFLMPNPFYRIR